MYSKQPIRLAAAIGLALTISGGGAVAAMGTFGQRPLPETSVPPDTSAADPVVDPGDGGNYQPELDPAHFVDVIDNPYLPLIPGSRWVYDGTSGEESERIEVVVTDERREIMGISAVVVRDTVYVADEVVEDTYDWFAQDTEGNVWYLGEDTHEYENGVAVNSAGAWEFGVDGALPGIAMPADPTVGEAYRQEFYQDEAEDMSEILSIDSTQTIGLGDYTDVVVTQDWTPLDPDVIEEKWYAPGVGLIYSTHTMGKVGTVELIEFTPGT